MADYHHDIAEKFLRAHPEGPFDYCAIGGFPKAAKTNNTVRGVYLALEKIKGEPLPCISSSEQGHMANEAHYKEIAEQMAKQAAHPPTDYAGIREYLDAKRNNNTVKGVYKELAKLQAAATCKECTWARPGSTLMATGQRDGGVGSRAELTIGRGLRGCAVFKCTEGRPLTCDAQL